MCVRSSSQRALESIITDGRTGGGGTGSTLTSIQSGRTNATSNPSARQSSSLMRRRISCAFAAVSSCLRSLSGIALSPIMSACFGFGNSIFRWFFLVFCLVFLSIFSVFLCCSCMG